MWRLLLLLLLVCRGFTLHVCACYARVKMKQGRVESRVALTTRCAVLDPCRRYDSGVEDQHCPVNKVSLFTDSAVLEQPTPGWVGHPDLVQPAAVSTWPRSALFGSTLTGRNVAAPPDDPDCTRARSDPPNNKQGTDVDGMQHVNSLYHSHQMSMTV